MFVKITSDGAQEAFFECEQVFVRHVNPDDPNKVGVLMERDRGGCLTRDVIKGHEEIVVLNNEGRLIERFNWPNAHAVAQEAVPRRFDRNRMKGAELAILDATMAVEEAGADPILTEAVVLLGQAREKVADYFDKPRKT